MRPTEARLGLVLAASTTSVAKVFRRALSREVRQHRAPSLVRAPTTLWTDVSDAAQMTPCYPNPSVAVPRGLEVAQAARAKDRVEALSANVGATTVTSVVVIAGGEAEAVIGVAGVAAGVDRASGHRLGARGENEPVVRISTMFDPVCIIRRGVEYAAEPQKCKRAG